MAARRRAPQRRGGAATQRLGGAATLCPDHRSNEYRKIRVRSNYQCRPAESISDSKNI